MKSDKHSLKHYKRSILWIVTALVMLFTTVAPDLIAQRRGGSFGGSRSSGRSYSAPRSGGGSFGGSRGGSYSRSPSGSTSRSSTPSATIPRNSFGGSRLSSSSDYTSRYGIPRQVQKQAVPGSNGTSTYVVNRYGGMGDGFMMGYMMGSIPWYYSMPFHPAYYYSRPMTVANPDGTTSIYPGTFQWGTLFFTLMVVGGIGFIIYVWLRNRRRRQMMGNADMSQSSFG